WLEPYALLNLLFQFGPYFVNVRNTVVADDLLHENLDPCGDAHDDPDVPVDGLARNLIELGIPIARSGDLLSGLIKVLKPKWQPCCLDAAQVAFEITTAMVEVGTSSQHENTRLENMYRKVIFREREHLTYARLWNRLH